MMNLPCMYTITVYNCDGIPTILTNIHNNYAKGYIIKKETFEPCYVARVNGYYAHGKTLREARNEAHNKSMKSIPIEERIERFKNKYPSLDNKASNYDLFKWHNFLTDSCLMGREIFASDNDIDLNKSMTIQDFLSLTSRDNLFGNEIMKKLYDTYKS